SRRAPSVVVPGTIPTRLPPRSTTLSMPDASVVRRLPPSRKVAIVKSTSVCRDSEAVVEPHSMSMVPSTTALIRFAGDTLTHFSRSSGRARSFWTASAIFRQRSTEYPAGLPSSPVNENGHDESRYPSVIVFVSLMPPPLLRSRQGGGGLEAVEGHPGVAVRHADQCGASVGVEADVAGCESTFRVRYRPIDDLAH